MASSEVKEVFTARDGLSGALSSAADRFGSEELFGSHGVFGSPIKRLQSLDSPLGTPTKSPRPQRRRKRKEFQTDAAFHHTFVMKLFDRSVDLAQFQPGTPLYPVCRAWMKNEPLNTNMVPRLRSPTPEPMDELEVDMDIKPEDMKKRINHDDDDDNNIEDDNSLEDQDGGSPAKKPKKDEKSYPSSYSSSLVFKLPAFEPLKVNKADGTEEILRVPKTEDPRSTVSSDKEFLDKIQNAPGESPTLEDLLREHMSHWYSVRSSWRSSAAKNEARYKPSMDLLKNMFVK